MCCVHASLGVRPSCSAWCFAEKAKRRNLHKEDVQAAVAHTEIFDFLVEVINTPEGGAAAGGAPGIAAAAAPASAPALPAMMGAGQAGMMGAMAGGAPQHQMAMGGGAPGMGLPGHGGGMGAGAGAPGSQYPGGPVSGHMQHTMAQAAPQAAMAGAPMQQQQQQHMVGQPQQVPVQQYVQNGAPPQM